MNNGRIWCVVNPTVGLPLFLGSVAVMAFTVHFAVLSHTTWFSDYWQGSRAKKSAKVETSPAGLASAGTQAGFNVSVTPVSATVGDAPSFVVTIAPSTGGSAKSFALAQGADSSPGGTSITK